MNVNNDWKKLHAELIGEGKFSEAQQLKTQYLPSSLYKYGSASQKTLDNLSNGHIYINTPGNFNDPYDCGFHLQQDDPSMEEIFKNSNDWLSRIKQLTHELKLKGENEKVEILSDMLSLSEETSSKLLSDLVKDKSYKIFCLTERNDSLLMWAHYADNHKGICIEYEIDSTIDQGFWSRCIMPVTYQNRMFDSTPCVSSSDPAIRFAGFILPTLFKTEDWQYEKEWRFVMHTELSGNLHRAPPIKAIYLGAKISSIDEQKIITFAKSKGITVYKGYITSPVLSVRFNKIL